MRQVICERCGKSIAQHLAIRVQERTLCEPCAEAELAERTDVPADSVSRLTDPTVCGVCQHDAGTVELETIGGIPVCKTCEDNLRNRPYPVWVKVALAAVLALTLFALLRNYRFIQAYIGIRSSERSAEQGDFAAAATRMEAAARRLPEIREYGSLAKMFRAIVHLQEDRPADALALMQEVAPLLPRVEMAQTLFHQADIGDAFEKQDYARMIASARVLADIRPADRFAKLSLASALACQYAASGDAADEKAAREHMPPPEDELSLTDEEKEYVNRIEHRLTTRDVINRKEFARRFPSGWKPELKP